MKTKMMLTALFGAAVLSGCATYPTGPTVMVMPGTGKSFEQFQQDDLTCRQFAQMQSGSATAQQTSTTSAVESAAVGTLLGAAAGTLIGNNHQGTAIGAGAGLLLGSAAGTGSSGQSVRMMQRQYDNAYVQCMYAKGDQVPSYSQMQRPAPAVVHPVTPPPPPPAGW